MWPRKHKCLSMWRKLLVSDAVRLLCRQSVVRLAEPASHSGSVYAGQATQAICHAGQPCSILGAGPAVLVTPTFGTFCDQCCIVMRRLSAPPFSGPRRYDQHASNEAVCRRQ